MTRVLKVSMPNKMYEDFVKDAEKEYDNCYWLKMKADVTINQKLIDAITTKEDLQVVLQAIREELIETINQKYKEDIAPLKREIMKARMAGFGEQDERKEK